MLKYLRVSPLLLTIFLFVWGCLPRKDEPVLPAVPSTSIFLNRIDLSDTSSLSGKVALFWSGESQNSIIKGYEVAVTYDACGAVNTAALDWKFTTRTDSLFLFPIRAGNVFDRITFLVRAVDNNGIKDPTPSCLEVPIKNSAPTIKLDRPLPNGNATTDTVHLTFQLTWVANDEDGDDNLDSIFISVDKTNWLGFSRTTRVATFIPVNPTDSLATDYRILLGNAGRESGKFLVGISLEDIHRVYVRAKDVAGAFSRIDSTNRFYLKRQKSDFLVLDAFKGTPAFQPDIAVYPPLLNSLFGANFDFYDFNRNNDSYIPQSWNLVFLNYLRFYKKVFWYSDAANYGTDNQNPLYLLDIAAPTLQLYMDNGGKLMLSITKLPTDLNTPTYNLTPVASISNISLIPDVGNHFIINNLYDTPDTLATLDAEIVNNAINTITLKFGSMDVLNATKLTNDKNFQPWTGSNTLGALAKGADGKTNMVFFGVPLHEFNGNPAKLQRLINHIITVEFE